MSGHTSAAAAAIGTVAAAATAGPLAQVFNELGILLAIMGAMGGLVAGAWPWRGGWTFARSVVVGAFLAFGLGVLSPHLLGSLLSVDLAQAGASVQALAAAAFVVGWLQDMLLEWMGRRRGVVK